MTAIPLPQHPILACIEEIGDALDSAADAQAIYLATGQKAAAMRELAALEARLAGLRLRVMAASSDVAEQAGSRDVGAWFSQHTMTEPDAARADARLAQSLDEERPGVAVALGAGRCSVAQARVIVRALDDVPDWVGRETVAQAEETLVGYAERFRPSELRRLGRRILDIVAPEIADAEEARRLVAEERHAREKTRLGFRALGDGTTRISGRLPDTAADRLRTYLEAFASPRAPGGSTKPEGVPTGSTTGEGERVPYPRRLGLALCALLEHLDPAELPAHGGDATTVMVTLTLDQLRSELATAGVIDGEAALATLSAAEARRLACTARIIPVVLGGESEILDLGRSRRLFGPAQRKAMRLRDQRCRAEGCTVPATWTEAHHLQSWEGGGPTDLANAILLCSHHHHRAHDSRYAAEHLPDGDLRFVRRR